MSLKELLAALHERRSKIDAAIRAFSELDWHDVALIEGALPKEEPDPPAVTIKRRGRPPKPEASTPPKTRRATDEPSTVLRCAVCGKQFMFQAWLDHHLAKAHARPRGRRVHVPLDDDDSDADTPPPLEPPSPPPRVRCLDCGELFPDAKSMGIHQTRVHFGAASLSRSHLGGV